MTGNGPYYLYLFEVILQFFIGLDHPATAWLVTPPRQPESRSIWKMSGDSGTPSKWRDMRLRRTTKLYDRIKDEITLSEAEPSGYDFLKT
jgi:hypothetical protein